MSRLSAIWSLAAAVGIAAAQSGAGSDPSYRALREAAPVESVLVEGVSLRRDAARIELRRGTVTFLAPVMGRVTGAVFTGEGKFTLQPGNPMEQSYMKSRTGAEAFTETFNEMLLHFTDETAEELKNSGRSAGAASGQASGVLTKWRRALRRNPEIYHSATEALISGENIDNVEAELLAELYCESRPGLFSAYFQGRKYKHVRYHIRARGALPFLPASEEVALLSVDEEGERDGVLYLAGLGGAVSGSGSKALIDVTHYAIDTTVGKNRRLAATAAISFTAVRQCARVLKFDLLPALRVSKVTMEGAGELPFIQEPREQDSAFYVVLPQGLQAGAGYKVTVAYAGDRVISGEGGGNFAVGARTSWYPGSGAFTDYADFDLTFRCPKDLTLVSIGQPVSSTKEGDLAVTRWRTPAPVAVAGFNYGRFKSKEATDSKTGYRIEGHAASEVPDYLKDPGGESLSGRMNPVAMMDKAMSEAQASIQIFTHYFGPSPYGRLAVTQQPQFSFGQSWPSLVYLPVSAFLDSTQRWLLMGSATFEMRDFIQEVTAHEVAHQWWGHVVGWSSYRDQWLSEGFSDFSAGLFLQATRKGDSEYRAFLKRWNEAILKKNSYGLTPNDAGAIAAGLRLNGHRTRGAFGVIGYAKGGFVLHMLRSMMFNPQDGGDRAFIEMMRDFVKTHAGRTASTADFQGVVEKHMPPWLDLDGNRKMDWFFRQWVYGNEIPRYKMNYSLKPLADGKCEIRLTVSQSGVSEDFRMPVRVYMTLDNRTLPLARLPLQGVGTSDEVTATLPVQPKELLLNYNYDVLAWESVAERAK